MLHLGVPQSSVTYVHGASDINDFNSHLSVILPYGNRGLRTHTTLQLFLLRGCSAYLQNLAVNCNY